MAGSIENLSELIAIYKSGLKGIVVCIWPVGSGVTDCWRYNLLFCSSILEQYWGTWHERT